MRQARGIGKKMAISCSDEREPPRGKLVASAEAVKRLALVRAQYSLRVLSSHRFQARRNLTDCATSTAPQANSEDCESGAASV
jgi:hypothetical protein